MIPDGRRTHSGRDVGRVLDGEVASRQLDTAVPTVAVQADDQRLDQTDAEGRSR